MTTKPAPKANGRPRVDYAPRVLDAIFFGFHTQTAMVMSYGMPKSSIQKALYQLLAEGRVERRVVTPAAGAAVVEWHARDPVSAVRRRDKTVRPCLCCQRAFISDGAHNRLCAVCRRKRLTAFDYCPN